MNPINRGSKKLACFSQENFQITNYKTVKLDRNLKQVSKKKKSMQHDKFHGASFIFWVKN